MEEGVKLEDQVCSLELARRLKELGVKQESMFAWHSYHLVSKSMSERWEVRRGKSYVKKGYSAFTVAELGEILFSNGNAFTTYGYPKTLKEWTIQYKTEGYPGLTYSEKGQTEADARSKMLIHLVENGIVKPQQEGMTKRRGHDKKQ